jgi:FkbM family methyltransferase
MSFVHIYNANPMVRKHFKPVRVIQAGAHGIDEIGIYQAAKIKEALFIEGDPENYAYAVNKLNGVKRSLGFQYTIINQALAETVRPVHLYRFPKLGGANSIIPANPSLGIPKPEISEQPVMTKTLDQVVAAQKKSYDALVLDCQGSEGMVLQGAIKTLPHIKYAFIEVWKPDRVGYEGSLNVYEIDALLIGFKRIAMQWPSDPCAWGYAFYLRV